LGNDTETATNLGAVNAGSSPNISIVPSVGCETAEIIRIVLVLLRRSVRGNEALASIDGDVDTLDRLEVAESFDEVTCLEDVSIVHEEPSLRRRACSTEHDANCTLNS